MSSPHIVSPGQKIDKVHAYKIAMRYQKEHPELSKEKHFKVSGGIKYGKYKDTIHKVNLSRSKALSKYK